VAARLTDRDSIKRALYRLVNTDDLDDAMLEHDATSLDGVYMALQEGVDDAQQYLVDSGLSDYWLTTSATLSFTGSDPDRYVALPATDTDSADKRFWRLYGDHKWSALRKANGERWGLEVPAHSRWKIRGNCYYLRNERLYLARSASPPSDVVMDYLYRLPDLVDSTTVDFPESDRPLIVAYAAIHAMENDWIAGGADMESKLMRNLERRKQAAYRRARRSLQPKMTTPNDMIGDHWFA
jgi:hypothetical protein